MRAEHPKCWMVEARADKYPDNSRWRFVVQIVQVDFKTGELATECTWSTVVLILRGGGVATS